MKILAFLEHQGKLFWSLTGFAVTLALGALDYLAGYELSFALFYLIPITLVTWFAGRSLGIFLSLASTITWILVDIASGHPHSSEFVPFWNSTFSLSFYIVVTLLLSALRNALENVKGLARLDSLTGAVNGRLFSDLVASALPICAIVRVVKTMVCQANS